MSAFASPATVVRGPLQPIHHEPSGGPSHYRTGRAGQPLVLCPVVYGPFLLVLVVVGPPLLDLLGLQDSYSTVGDRQYPRPLLLCALIHHPPMSLPGTYSILVVLLLFLTKSAVRVEEASACAGEFKGIPLQLYYFYIFIVVRPT